MSELIRNLLNNLLNEELNSMEIFLSNRMTYSVYNPNNIDADEFSTVTLTDNDEIVKITTVMMNGCKNTIYIPISEITFISTTKECPKIGDE